MSLLVLANPVDKVSRITCGNFINILYKVNILDCKKWPTPKVLEEMHMRGLIPFISQKPSYGFPSPPLLSFDESLKWAVVLRLIDIKSNSH